MEGLGLRRRGSSCRRGQRGAGRGAQGGAGGDLRWFPRELVRRDVGDDRMGPPVSEGERGIEGVRGSWAELRRE